MVTIRDLIEDMKKMDPERVVILAKDAEGSSYSPLHCFSEGAYREETMWYGEAGLEKLTKEDREIGFSEEDVIRDGIPCVILRPIS